ncbi:hypothetical protein L838_1660 [Mycobacterium avium MAV_120709_2344]|nr:hypothetical protein L838_1660 [Mycobacterium avium MAV_120709_2344]
MGQRRDLFKCRHRLSPWVIELINPTLVREGRLVQCRFSGTRGR